MSEDVVYYDANRTCAVLTSNDNINENSFKNASNLKTIFMDKEILLRPNLILDLSKCINLESIEISIRNERDEIRNTVIDFIWTTQNNTFEFDLKDLLSGKVLELRFQTNIPITINRSCIGMNDFNIITPSHDGSNLEINLEDIVTKNKFVYSYIQGKDSKLTINRSYYGLDPIAVDLVKAEDRYVMLNMNKGLFKEILNPETEVIDVYYANIIEEAAKSFILYNPNSYDVVNYNLALIKKNKNDIEFPVRILVFEEQ